MCPEALADDELVSSVLPLFCSANIITLFIPFPAGCITSNISHLAAVAATGHWNMLNYMQA